jgi:DNA polymerase-3 subunit delta
MKILKQNTEDAILNPHKQNLRGILVYGSDIGVIDYTEDAIKNKFTDHELIKLDLAGEKTVKDVLNEILTPSFFGEKKFLHITGMDTKCPEFDTILQKLEGFDGFILIVFKQNLDAKLNLRKLAENSKNLGVIACYADEDGDIVGIVNKFLSLKKLTIEPDALRWIVQNFKGNRGVLMMELAKLSLFKMEGKITLLEAKNIMDEESEGNIFEAINHFFAFNKIGFIKEIENLKEQIPASVLMINIINYNFKLMEILNERDATRKTFDTILAEKFIFFKQIPIMKNHLSKWNLKMLDSFALLMLETEIEVRKNTDAGYNSICSHFLNFLNNLNF